MLRDELRHYLHPINIYCRLCDTSISRERACQVCKWYERNIWRWLKKLIELLPKHKEVTSNEDKKG